jgi:hypothetical protein
VDRHRLLRRGEAAGAVVIVGRVKALEVNEVRPAGLVLHRDRQLAVADGVGIGGRPAVTVGDHADALRAQRVELDRLARPVLGHLHKGIAVQQQLRGERFQQRLPGARRHH